MPSAFLRPQRYKQWTREEEEGKEEGAGEMRGSAVAAVVPCRVMRWWKVEKDGARHHLPLGGPRK